MEKRQFIQTPERRIKTFLQDYANNFVILRNFFKKGGMEMVRKTLRDDFNYKIPTVSEHLKQCEIEGRESINRGDEGNIIFIEKSQRLDELANEINSLKDSIDEEKFFKIFNEVNDIISK